MAMMAAMAKMVDGALLAIVIVPSPTDLTILSNALTPTGYCSERVFRFEDNQTKQMSVRLLLV